MSTVFRAGTLIRDTVQKSNQIKQVADQRFSLKQWFAQSRRLRKPGCGHCYVRFFNQTTITKSQVGL